MNKPHFWELISSREAVVRYAKSSTQRIKIKSEKVLSQKEIKKMVRTTVNKKYKDGRISGIGKDGKYASHSVSPYSKVFLDNIEEKIQELIMALVKKGYLPISSCQGHSLDEERHIQLCFKSHEEIDKFKKEITKSELLPKYLQFETTKAEDFLNTKVEVTNRGISIQRVKPNNIKEGVTEYFQAMFWQHSENWLILHMIIIDEMDERLSFWQIAKRWYYKTFKLEKQTKNLAEHIRKNVIAYDSCDYK